MRALPVVKGDYQLNDYKKAMQNLIGRMLKRNLVGMRVEK